MKKLRFSTLLLLAFFFHSDISAQGIKGHIKNAQGEPLAFATIFIQQTGSGTVTNDEGFYEIDLAPGDYSIVYQFLGYNTLVKKISIGSLFKEEDIVLQPQSLELGTVEIYEGREDPAYTIMRKAIAKADYHRQQVEHYTMRVYIKGSGRLKEVPWFARRQLRKEGIDTSSAFLVESVNEVEYQRPGILKEKVISIRKQGNENEIDPAPYVNESFYHPKIADAVSPLSPRAFAYYRFELEGTYRERGHEINKIKVTPRNRGEGTFEGTIYILEDLWSIHSLDLATYKLGFKINLNQIYAPILENVWMPVTHRISAAGKIFGFDFEYKYLATTSDYKIVLNPDLDAEFTVIDETIEKEAAKAIEENRPKKERSDFEKKIASGEELTRKDLRKMMKEYEKEDRKNREKEEDEPIVDSNRTFETDSAAQTRDSAYWAEIRPIPLTKYEVRGYHRADSLAIVEIEEKEKEAKKDSLRSGGSFFPTVFETLFSGNSFKLSKNTHLNFGSVILKTNYNAVERWNTSIPISLKIKTGKSQTLRISPTYNIAFSPFVHDGNLAVNYSFGKPFRRAKIGADAGQALFQFNPDNPVNLLWEETFFLLFEERNFAKFYQKRYFNAFAEKQVSDHFSIKLFGEAADRSAVYNHENADSWIKYSGRSLTPNNPDLNPEINPSEMPDNEIVTTAIGFRWLPYQKYRMYNGKKMKARNIGPVFHSTFRKGFDLNRETSSEYNFVKAGIDWDYEMPAGTMLRFRTKAGKFFNKRNLYFPDFHHFRGNRTRLVFEEPVGNFRLLPYYQFSAGDEFFEFHFHSQFRQLAVTQIPELWMLGLKENLIASYLTTPKGGHYFEVGYGLDNLYKIFRLEFVASFLGGKYEDFGIRVGIASGFNISGNSDDEGEAGVTVKL